MVDLGTYVGSVCTCWKLTAGRCPACAPSRPVPTFSVTLDTSLVTSLEARIRERLAEITREFAAREAGPVGIRLRQIADEFEGA